MLFFREFRPIDSQQSSSHLFHLVQRKYYLVVESRPVGWVGFVWFVVGLSLSFSPPSDCISLPSMMTWAPCPHGVRTRGKKERCLDGASKKLLLSHATFKRSCHASRPKHNLNTTSCRNRKRLERARNSFENAIPCEEGCVLWVSVGLCIFLEVHHSERKRGVGHRGGAAL